MIDGVDQVFELLPRCVGVSHLGEADASTGASPVICVEDRKPFRGADLPRETVAGDPAVGVTGIV
jgi:hypothetical protein